MRDSLPNTWDGCTPTQRLEELGAKGSREEGVENGGEGRRGERRGEKRRSGEVSTEQLEGI